SLCTPVDGVGLPDPSAAKMPLVDVPNIGNELPRRQGEIPQVPANADGIGRVVEEQVLQMSDGEDLQKERGQVGELTESAKSLSDGESLKQQPVNQAQEHVVDHFAGQETELQKAIETISKYKKKYGSFQNLEEIATRHRNVMHGKPL